MSLSPETSERLIEAGARALPRVIRVMGGWDDNPGYQDNWRREAAAVLAVVLDDPQVTITERTAVPPHHHEYVGGRCYRCGLASPTQWIGALDGRPVSPENETSSDDR